MLHGRVVLSVVAFGLLVAWNLAAHDHSRPKADQQQLAALQRAQAAADLPLVAGQPGSCHLVLRLRDAAGGGALPGIVRIVNLGSGRAVTLSDEIHRELNWFAVPAETIVTVPAARLRIEACHGIETEMSVQEVDLTAQANAVCRVSLRRFYQPREQGLRSGNTHLHLSKLTFLEALRYLQVVPAADGLDLVFLSHLRRVPDERDYVSNQIVENSFAGGELQRLSLRGVLFGNGQEHRHNFGRGGEGYGHVMLLDLQKLIHPVSIGPGIMGEGTDGRPLQAGIREARADGATVIWCHNTFGYEDLPNWLSGMLHAQNIFDGGEHGSYQDTYYRYLNLGMHVPFSSGTDWFIYDFSRVYVPLSGELTSRRWLDALRAEKSYITNGVFLEFTVNGEPIGSTIRLAAPGELRIRGRALGRNGFRAVELVHNGEVISSVPARREGGHFVAELATTRRIDQPGWLALRIPLDAGQNEFDKPLFAHTSAIHLELAGRRIFRMDVAQQLLNELRQGISEIQRQGKFANETERDAVLQVHRAGTAVLEQRVLEQRVLEQRSRD